MSTKCLRLSLYLVISLILCSSTCLCKHKKHKHAVTVRPAPEKPFVFKNDSFCQAYIQDGNICMWKGPPHISINNTSPCIFGCSYDPSSAKPVRFGVHLISRNPLETNVFVSNRQNHVESTWTLPILFPESYGTNQIFTSIEEILCPPRKESNENIYFRIETWSEKDVNLNFSMIQIPYQIKLNENVTVVSSPVSSWFKYYEWEPDQESVLVTVDNVANKGMSVCAILSLQNAQCPMELNKKGIVGSGIGRYQTFQQRGGMVAKKYLFPDGIHIVLLPLSDDVLCIGYDEVFSNKTSRSKSTRLQVLPHKTLKETWGIFIGVALVIASFVFSATFIILKFIQRNFASLTSHEFPLDEDDVDQQLVSSEYLPDDCDQTTNGNESVLILDGSLNNLIPEEQQPSGLAVATNRIVRSPNLNQQNFRNDGNFIPGDLVIRQQLLGVRGAQLVDPSSNQNQIIPDALEPNRSFNPRSVYWWKVSTEFSNMNSNDALVSKTGFHMNLIIVAVFMALPLSEILKSYLHVFHSYGSEDQCYFNSRCIISCGIIPDFARIFTNVGYLLCGLCFAFLIKQHEKLNWVVSKGELLGVSRNYSLFMALSIGLIIQFVMSGLYHMCPNIITLRFDMMFMYVEAIVLVIGVWGLRHDNVANHVYPTVGMVGLSLLMAEAKNWVNQNLFWTGVLLIHGFYTMTMSFMLYKTSTWSFSPTEMYQIWKKWKYILGRMRDDIFTDETSIKPWTLLRMIIGVLGNFVLILIGFIFDVEIYMYILLVCLVNMGLYVTNYILTKKLHREKGTVLAWICLLMSLMFWIIALIFYFWNNTNTHETASASREMNSNCIIFGVFDAHDIWHLTSSFAIFFSLVGILTLDDDLANENPQNFASF